MRSRDIAIVVVFVGLLLAGGAMAGVAFDVGREVCTEEAAEEREVNLPLIPEQEEKPVATVRSRSY